MVGKGQRSLCGTEKVLVFSNCKNMTESCKAQELVTFIVCCAMLVLYPLPAAKGNQPMASCTIQVFEGMSVNGVSTLSKTYYLGFPRHKTLHCGSHVNNGGEQCLLS